MKKLILEVSKGDTNLFEKIKKTILEFNCTIEVLEWVSIYNIHLKHLIEPDRPECFNIHLEYEGDAEVYLESMLNKMIQVEREFKDFKIKYDNTYIYEFDIEHILNTNIESNFNSFKERFLNYGDTNGLPTTTENNKDKTL